MSFLIKLSEDGAVPKRVQLLRTGAFNYDGEAMNITSAMLQSFVKNFNEKVRGYEDGKLPVDYFHENEKIAAGWIASLTIEVEDTELWAEVHWTPKAEKILADGELRYLSVEFSFDYESNEGGKRFGPTLFGAGLTNRPFIKGMKPVKTLSEGDYKMTPEQMQAKIAELEAMIADLKKQVGGSAEALAAAKTEADGLKQEKAMSEKKASFDKMLSEGKAVEAQREPFMSGDMTKFAELAKPLNSSSKGGSGEGEPTNTAADAQDKIHELALKAMAQDKNLSYKQAVSKVLDGDKKLHDQYKNEVKLAE